MYAVLISDPAEAEMEALRPEAELWTGPTIAHLSEIGSLVFGD